MSDRAHASIRIGGNIPQADIQELLDLLHDVGLLPKATTNELFERIDKDGVFESEDDQARYGGFDDVESYCRKVGLAYERTTDSNIGVQSCIVHYAGGENAGISYICTGDGGDEQVDTCVVTEMLDRFEVCDTLEDVHDLIEELRDMPEICARHIPPFYIVEYVELEAGKDA